MQTKRGFVDMALSGAAMLTILVLCALLFNVMAQAKKIMVSSASPIKKQITDLEDRVVRIKKSNNPDSIPKARVLGAGIKAMKAQLELEPVLLQEIQENEQREKQERADREGLQKAGGGF